jgi:septal ring factor EnvC (AmiA/AmiB activator)
MKRLDHVRGSRKVRLVAAVAVLLLLSHPAVADALAAADVAVAVARARLTAATAELAAARRRRADALVALETASDEVGRQEARLAGQVRRAYMTGRVSGLAVVVQASDLRDLLERAVTLSDVIRADQEVLGRLELARRRSVRLHAAMVEAEQARAGAETRVRGQVGELERVRAVRQQAKERLDARVARLAGPRPPCAAAQPSCSA